MASIEPTASAALPVPVGFLLPQFLGIIFNWGLFGALLVQVYMYYTNSHGDRFAIKALVYAVFLADILQTIFLTHLAYHILVGSWGNFDILVHRPWSSLTLPIMNGVLSGVIQIFFAWRIWILTNKSKLGYTLALVIVAVALLQSIAAIESGIRFVITSDVSGLAKIFAGCVVWLAGSVVCDVIITISMFYVLTIARGKMRFRQTDTLVSRLIYMTVQTGLLTSFIAGAELVLLVGFRNAEYHEAPGYLLGKMYSNALLATLNARATHQKNTDVLSTGTLRADSGSVGTSSTLSAMQYMPNKQFNNGPAIEIKNIDKSQDRGAIHKPRTSWEAR